MGTFRKGTQWTWTKAGPQFVVMAEKQLFKEEKQRKQKRQKEKEQKKDEEDKKFQDMVNNFPTVTDDTQPNTAVIRKTKKGKWMKIPIDRGPLLLKNYSEKKGGWSTMIYQKTKINDRTKLREKYKRWTMFPPNKYTRSEDMKIDERDWSEFLDEFPPPNAPVANTGEMSDEEGEEKEEELMGLDTFGNTGFEEEELPSQPQPPKEDGKPMRPIVPAKASSMATAKPGSKGKKVTTKRIPSNSTDTAEKLKQQGFAAADPLDKVKLDLKPPEPVDSMIR